MKFSAWLWDKDSHATLGSSPNHHALVPIMVLGCILFCVDGF